jgi:single-stranded-DNA-specific exonuclease
VVIAYIDDERATGSMRSARGFDATALLTRFADLLVHYGGHQAAAGFSILRSNLSAFLERLQQIAPSVEFDAPESEKIDIDAELPHQYMTPDLIKIVDSLEPYGKDNRELRFVVRGVTIVDAKILGKTERTHLKLTFQCGEGKSAPKWPGIYWGAAERFGRDFALNDRVDVVFSVERNNFGGTESIEMNIADMEKSGAAPDTNV